MTEESLFARVSGELTVNDRGCFALGGEVLVVGDGSSVLPGGDGIRVADVGEVRVGERTSGAGGHFNGVEEVEQLIKAADLDDDAWRCYVDASRPALVLLDPASA